MSSSQSFDRSSVEYGRGVSFFDAIYGFAITLLVTNVDLPAAEAWQSPAGVWNSGIVGQLFGFLLSFVVIATFWRVNFRYMSAVTRMSPRIVIWNITASFFIILLPFSTQGTSDPATAGLPLPTALYALNIALASLSQTLLYLSARKHGQIPSMQRTGPAQTLLHLTVPAVFLASIPVIFLAGPVPGRLVWAILVIASPVAGRYIVPAEPPPAGTAAAQGS
ncbi:TMEM175 family protein [Arthrobacter sp. ATA002]|uniref:TMEM175 family protein n=1 Tax=Arthrobacter sp. ATA002 TaxID=2991715 RepID=UPI0022A78286|nr:TMEM175 family protein [Arthrobacter sp. ATA002]WAP50969.1 TMEM175 family protein [Arthrobacter sp. ATA002]